MTSPAIGHPGEAGHAGYAAFAAMADIANQTFDGFERLARLNLQTMKTTLAEQHGTALEAVDGRTFDWVFTLPVMGAQAGFKKVLAYWQHVHSIAIETASNNVGAGWEGFTEWSRWFTWAPVSSTRTRLGASLVLSAQDAGLPVPVAADVPEAAKPGGKKRSVDIVDSAGHVVSSVKQ